MLFDSGPRGDRTPVHALVKQLHGTLFSLSVLLTQLLTGTTGAAHHSIAQEHEKHLLHLSDKLLLRKRACIESIIDQSKNISETLAFSSPPPDQCCRPSAQLCSSPAAIKTKSQACISINTCSWLLERFHFSITHVP